MRRILSLTTFFCIITLNPGFSQVDFLSGLSNPNSICFDADTMYYSETGTSTISKITDLDNPVPEVVVTGVSPIDMRVHNGKLYISDGSTIKYFDLGSSGSSLTTLVSGVGNVSGLIFYGDTMLFGNTSNQLTMRMNVMDSNAVPHNFISNYFGIGMALKLDTLYIASGMNNAITRHVISDSVLAANPTVMASGLSFPAAGALFNSHFYFTETNGNMVTKIGTDSPFPKTTLFAAETPYRLAVHGDFLYVCAGGSGSILKYDLTFTNVSETDESQVNVFPNPNDGTFMLEAPETGSWTVQVYNSNGQRVLEAIHQGKSFPIELNLEAGVYFLQLTNGNTVITKRFIRL